MPVENSITLTPGSKQVDGYLTGFSGLPGDALWVRGVDYSIETFESTSRLFLKFPWRGEALTDETEWEIRKRSESWYGNIETNRLAGEVLRKINAGMPFKVDARGTLAGRAAFDDRLPPFVYLQDDVQPAVAFVKNSSTLGDWSPGVSIGGPPGPAGPEGPAGEIGPAGPMGDVTPAAEAARDAAQAAATDAQEAADSVSGAVTTITATEQRVDKIESVVTGEDDVIVPGVEGPFADVLADRNDRVVQFTREDGSVFSASPSGSGYEKHLQSSDVPAGVEEEVIVPGLGPVIDVTYDTKDRVSEATTPDGVRWVAGRKGEGLIRASSDPLNVDVAVYGAGIAGLMAATRAFLRGKTVHVMDPFHRVGGYMAGGLAYIDYPDGGDSTIASRGVNLMQGLTRQFFLELSAIYGSSALLSRFEPRVIRDHYLRRYAALKCQVALRTRLSKQSGQVLLGVDGNNRPIIKSIVTPAGIVRASQFIDASYEGDLMAAAGVPYAWGREAASEFNEYDRLGNPYAGYKPGNVTTYPLLVNSVGAKRLLPPPSGAAGSADKKTQAYNFRCVLTNRATLKVPFKKPDNYDRAEYLIPMQNAVQSSNPTFLQMTGDHGIMPILGTATSTNDRKIPTNSTALLSADLAGWNYDYPEGSWATRDKIAADHALRQAGWYYYLQNDIVQHAADLGLAQQYRDKAALIMADAQNYGYAADEFEDSPYIQGFSDHLYMRETRRMRGMEVLTLLDQNSPVSRPASLPGDPPAWPNSSNTKPDPIAVWNYARDTHPVQHWLEGTTSLKTEGSYPSSVLNYTDDYQIPMGAILPPVGSIANLSVPVCHSATSVFYSSSRMEPLFGMLGEAAGEIAVLAIEAESAVQDVDYPTLAARLLERGSLLA